ncbi:MAG: SdiA-regulated domain-containing protein [Cyclobacteriaceae bacterium]|nr:SdiA-regulated domain-containing protein [Cyclobacteriaceae bacterium]
MEIKDIYRSGQIFSLLASTLFLFSIGMACITDYGEEHMFISSGDQKYFLNEPDEKFILPGRLEEISGLDYLGDHILLCIEDENGILYFYNTKEKKVTREIKFAGSGDYEGVTHIGNTAYVIRSDGVLYKFPIDRDNDSDAEKIETPFRASNEIEGLTVGHDKNELYLACKENPAIENNKAEGRAVYAFDLTNRKPKTQPIIQMTSEFFGEAMKNMNLKPSHFMPYKPSGITIHPISGDAFILGSVGKLLIVLNKKGKIIDAAPLSRKIYFQPEGICFDESGKLYISSEGGGKDGYILAFNPSED